MLLDEGGENVAAVDVSGSVYNSTASLERKRSWMGRRCCSVDDDIAAAFAVDFRVAVGPAVFMSLENYYL